MVGVGTVSQSAKAMLVSSPTSSRARAAWPSARSSPCTRSTTPRWPPWRGEGQEPAESVAGGGCGSSPSMLPLLAGRFIRPWGEGRPKGWGAVCGD
ncbi:hypothetical protein GW17_00015136 [Ensete ventricosum]|nr:hypothetical protein GW17_00015136 [Ensete ventricosum]